MKRVKENVHTLQVLKNARPKLRKAIISNCDRDLVNSISECVLNILNGNVALTGCVKRKLSKHTLALRRLVDRRVPIQGKKRLILQRGVSNSPYWQPYYQHLLVSQLPSDTIMLHKMYLVPADEYHPHTKRGRPPRGRRTKQHPHTEWIKLRTKHREAELRRNSRTKEIADYMKQILPAATNPQTPDLELPNLKAKSRRGTQTDVT